MHTSKSRWMKFDPTINSGTIIQIVVIIVGIVGGYSRLAATQEVQAEKTSAIIAQQSREAVATEKTLYTIQGDVKDLAKIVQAVKEDVAVLRGRAAETSALGAKR